MGFKEITIGVVMATVFALALINFGSMLAINNNAQNNILDDPSLSGLNDSIQNHLSGVQEIAQTQREVFENQEAQGGTADEGFSLTSIVGSVKTFFSVAMSSFNLIFGVISNVLGIPAIVLNVLLGALIMIGMILIWRLIKVGGT